MPLRASAILIQSSDPETLANWYAAGFDLAAPKRTGPDHVGLMLDNVYLGFDLVEQAEGRGATVIWFDVEDADASCARLAQAGATVTQAPDRSCSPGEVLARLQDPQGNPIGLIAQVKP